MSGQTCVWTYRGPNKCHTAFFPVAGLTGVARLPEWLLNQIHMASVCSIKYT